MACGRFSRLIWICFRQFFWVFPEPLRNSVRYVRFPGTSCWSWSRGQA